MLDAVDYMRIKDTIIAIKNKTKQNKNSLLMKNKEINKNNNEIEMKIISVKTYLIAVGEVVEVVLGGIV